MYFSSLFFAVLVMLFFLVLLLCTYIGELKVTISHQAAAQDGDSARIV